MNYELKIYIDGASRGNPGPAGIGIVVEALEGNVIRRHREYIGEATNNVAEYKALIKALEIARELKAKYINVYSDSDLIVKQVNEVYRVKNENLRKLCKEALSLKNNFKKVNILSIPRGQNKAANKLSEIAIDLR